MLLPLLTKEVEEAEDVRRAGVGDRLAVSLDELLRETVRLACDRVSWRL